MSGRRRAPPPSNPPLPMTSLHTRKKLQKTSPRTVRSGQRHCHLCLSIALFFTHNINGTLSRCNAERLTISNISNWCRSLYGRGESVEHLYVDPNKLCICLFFFFGLFIIFGRRVEFSIFTFFGLMLLLSVLIFLHMFSYSITPPEFVLPIFRCVLASVVHVIIIIYY